MDTVELNRKFSNSAKKLTTLFNGNEADEELKLMTECFRTLYIAYIGEKEELDSKESKTEEIIQKNKLRADKIEEQLKTLK
jgi:hypothetical protein